MTVPRPLRTDLGHLLDRARRGTALPAEHDALRQAVADLVADRDRLHRQLAAAIGRKAGLRLARQPRQRKTRVDRIESFAALRLAAAGLSNAQIGRRLNVSADTVKADLTRIYSLLGAIDRAHAVGLGLRLGLISLGDVPIPEKLRLDRAA